MSEEVIGRHSIIAEVLREYPATAEVFERYWFTREGESDEEQWVPAGDASIEVGAVLYSADLAQLLADLNQVAGTPGPISQLAVVNTLKTCFDPEIPLDVVNLGLVYDVRIDGRRVEVDVTRFARDCELTPQVLAVIDGKLRGVPGVQSVQVNLVWEPPWQPERLSDFARRRLGFA